MCVVTLGFSFVDWVILGGGREKQEVRVWKKAPVPTTTTAAVAAAPPPPALD